MSIFRKKFNLKAMTQIVPTSKFDLKLQCIAIARGDVTEAERIYNYFAADLTLPDVAPPPSSVMDTIKSTAGGLFSFVKENRDDIAQAVQYVQSLRGASALASSPAPATLPPLPPL
jgi:hypothetical protein